MKNILLLIFALLYTFSWSQNNLTATNYVNDFANLLSDNQEDSINSKLSNFQMKTDIQFSIVTVNSLDRDIESFTNDLFNKWGVGNNELNNGLMILIAPNEREWRIEVGYGLEKWLSDGYTSSIADETLPTYFRESDYYSGIDELSNLFIERLSSDSWVERMQKEEDLAIEMQILKEKRAEKNAIFLEKLKVFSFFLILFIIVASIFYLIYKFFDKRRKKKIALKMELDNAKKSNSDYCNKLLEKIEEVKKIDSSFDSKDVYSSIDLIKKLVAKSDHFGDIDNVISIRESINKIGDVHFTNLKNHLDNLNIFEDIEKFVKFNVYENKKNSLLDIAKSFSVRNSNSKYKILFDDIEILKLLNIAKEFNTKMIDNLSFKNLSNLISYRRSCIYNINSSEKLLNDFIYRLTSFEKANSNMLYLSKNVPNHISTRANIEIQNEKDKRRREKEDLLRTASLIYTRNSYRPSSSSSSSFGGFGKGSSGGGGSSGKW